MMQLERIMAPFRERNISRVRKTMVFLCANPRLVKSRHWNRKICVAICFECFVFIVKALPSVLQ